jgi:ribosome-associated protein
MDSTPLGSVVVNTAAPPAPPPSRPSKTQRKKDMHALQDLGELLVELPDDSLLALPADPGLIEAVQAYRRTRSHEGRRRQMQYIGKLMRKADDQPLREAVAAFQLGHARDALALHQSERWREALVADDTALTRWASEHPEGDLQQLRSLVRAARREGVAEPGQRQGRAWRELFQFLRRSASAPQHPAHLAAGTDTDEPND